MIEAKEFLYVQYDPLNVTKSLREVGGTVKQVYYADSHTYVPNRELTPLVLQPVIVITDPNNILSGGDKAGQLASSAWYAGGISEANRITALQLPENTGEPYVLGSNASLVVRKNVSRETPVTLFFKGEFYDSRRGSNVSVSMSILLSTTSNSESMPSPTLVLSKPAGWTYNPLKGTGNQTVSAQLYQSGSAIADSHARYWWYVIENNRERLIGSSNTDFFYVSGQDTKTLSLNPEYMKNVMIRCKAQYYGDTKPTAPGITAVTAETSFVRKYPASLHGKVNVRTGEIIAPHTDRIKLEGKINIYGGEIVNPEKYFFIRWHRNTMTPGSQDTEIGHGAALTIGRSVAGIDSSQVPRVSFTAEEHNEYQAFTDKSGNLLTDKNNNILTGY